MINYRTIIRANRLDKKGLAMIYFIVKNNWISTGLKIDPKYFDANKGTIKSSYNKFFIVSPQLTTFKSKCEQYLAQLNFSGDPFNTSKFNNFVFNQIQKNESIQSLIKDYVNKSNLSWGRSKHYKVLSKQLNDYRQNCSLSDIDYNFAKSFQQYLRTIGNVENTINSKIKKLKAIVHYAVNLGLLERDPLVNLKLSEIQPERIFLTEDELNLLENYYNSTNNATHKKILQYFLFSCYTGLRFGDIASLKINSITTTAVYVLMRKTKKPILVPLIEKAKLLIDYQATEKVFQTISNEKTNYYLKEIGISAGIYKTLTYHCSRHTFATLSIYYGIPQEIVAELLGVNDKTVKIYAKIMEQVKFTQMEKWGKTQHRS